VAIGERRRPDPGGRPGYLRVDTVHQGDTENGKGVFHINAVDEVTQWEIAASVERISEYVSGTGVVTILTQFPLSPPSFTRINGSEFINQTVAKLLNKLMIEQNQESPSTLQRQWAGGNQERAHHPQTYGLGPHSGCSCAAHPAVL